MVFTKQAEFTKKVTDLTDVPSQNMPPSEIKTYFQTPSDELKNTVNKLVDDLNANGWVDTNKIAPKGVNRTNIAPGSVGTIEMDPAILAQPNTLLGAQAQLQQVNEQLADTTKNIVYIEQKKYRDLCPKDGTGIITDWYSAISQALADLKTLGGGQLRFAVGSYPYTQTPIIDFYCKMVGTGFLPTQLKPIGCDGLKITIPFVQLEFINIDSGNIVDDTTSNIGLNVQDGSALYLRNVYVKNMGTGLSVNDGSDSDTYAGHYGIVEGCHFTYNNYGVKINNVANMWNFFGGTIMNNRIKGIELFDTENINFQGVSIESHPSMTSGQTVNDMITSGKLAIHIRSSIPSSLNQVISKVTFRDCWLEIGNAFIESGYVTFDSCRLVNLFNIFGFVPINFKNMNKKETTINLCPPVSTWLTGTNVILTTTKSYDSTDKKNYYKVVSTAGVGSYKAVYGLTTDVQGAALDSRLYIGFWIKKVTLNNNVYPMLIITDMNGNSYTANLTTQFPSFSQNNLKWQFIGATVILQGTNLNTILKDCTLRLELADLNQDSAVVNSPTTNLEVWIGENPIVRVLDMESELNSNQSYVRKLQSSWTPATLQNAWVNSGGTYANAGYLKDELGVVNLQGMVRSGTIGQAILTLPVGYRPINTKYMVTTANGVFAQVKINQDGTVVADVGNNAWFSLENIRFRTD